MHAPLLPMGRRARGLSVVVGVTALATALLVPGSGARAATPYLPTSLPISATGGGIAFAPDGSVAYATDSRSHTLRVVDVATRTTTASVVVGNYPSGVAVTPDGGTVVVTNQGSDTVSLVDTATDSVTATVPVGDYPTSVAITPDGSRAFVVDLGDGYHAGALTVVDLRDATVTATTALGVNPEGIAITPDGSRALVAIAGHPGDQTPGTLAVIDTATAEVRRSIPVGLTPDDVAVGPSGTTAYATNYSSGTLSVVDLASGTATATVPVDDDPGAVTVSPDGARVYVANAGDQYRDNGSVTMVDTTTNAVRATVPVGGAALGIAASSDGRSVWAPNENGTIGAIDLATMAWAPATARIAGADRYTTSAAVARAAFPGTVPVAYLATGTNFPDALSAASAAAARRGPLLLSDPHTLPAATSSALSTLRPRTIVLVGGTSAVSAALQTQIADAARAWGGTVEREAGADRYATGRLIVEKAFPSAGRVFVATGANYPDALSASAAAGAAGVPVVLVNGTASGLDAPTRALLTELGATEFDVVGGTAAVSAGVQTDLQALGTVQRFAGSDRYATSAAINAVAFPSPARAFYVTGVQFPDALSGAVLAAVRGAPLYVVQPTCVPSATADTLADAGTSSVTLIGGPNALGAPLTAQATCG